jgi:thiaminase/transcriptional activator TenA
MSAPGQRCETAAPDDSPFEALTAQLWHAAEPVYEQIRVHPFLVQLAEGSLDRDIFRLYVVQDAAYIGVFARVLGVLASRAPTRADTAALTARAGELAAEHELHDSLLAGLGVSREQAAQTPMAPATLAYTDHLLAAAHTKPFVEAYAAALACPWIYWEVGKELIDAGSPDPLYARWIELYGGDTAGANVPPLLALADRVGEIASPEQRRDAADAFVTGCRYEWLFWDAAYHRRGWPV